MFEHFMCEKRNKFGLLNVLLCVNKFIGRSRVTTIFLRESFKFSIQQSMLGICTGFKEHMCYTQKKHDNWNY
jgi:hypothetical protein